MEVIRCSCGNQLVSIEAICEKCAVFGERKQITTDTINFIIRTVNGKTEMVDKQTGELWEQKKRLK